jgi:hypothetical protein
VIALEILNRMISDSGECQASACLLDVDCRASVPPSKSCQQDLATAGVCRADCCTDSFSDADYLDRVLYDVFVLSLGWRRSFKSGCA